MKTALKKNKNGYEHILPLDGVNGFVSRVANQGQRITVTGWCFDHWKWKEKDRILLQNKEDGSATRYRIESIRRPRDPGDMYFIDCRFLPRHILAQ